MSLFGEMTWTRAELAEVLGLTPQRVGQLCQEGVLPKPGQGHVHDPKTAVAAYIQHLRTSQVDETRAKEETEKLRLDNALKRLKLERATGELMAREAVKQAWFSAGRQIRDTLENLPDRLAGPLAAETDQAAIFALLNNELRQLLETLARVPDVKSGKALQAV